WIDIMTSQWGFDLRTSHMRLLHNRGAAAPGFFTDVTEKAGFATKNDHVWTSLGSVDAALNASYVDKFMAAGTITASQAAEAIYYDGGVAQAAPNDQRTFSGQLSFAPAFVDLDGDGWQDIAITSDYGTSRIFWNRGDGTFADGTATAGVSEEEHGMGSTFGDYDGDGKLDWFVTSIAMPDGMCAGPDPGIDCLASTGNRLYRNRGDRTFEDATDAMGVRQGYWGWGTAFFDYDNDGDLDLTMTNGMNVKKLFRNDPLRFWENEGPGKRMVEEAARVGLEDRSSGKGLLTFDYDGDGDLDLFVVNDNAPPRLMRNDGGNKNAWLTVRVRGTRSNRDGLGAIVEMVRADGAAAQVREIGAATHFLGQSERAAFFGLGASDAPVKEVRVRWPASGKMQTFTDVPARSVLEATEPR
ncbi:MAG TPA: CRTAC1 family protein, partial [Patescibacteria group bacterium]|nr:CRTAC1 family protein [Patescibacteria group bacterium]